MAKNMILVAKGMGNTVFTPLDFCISSENGEVVVLSILDTSTKVKKIVADLVGGQLSQLAIRDVETGKEKSLRRFSSGYTYKSEKVGDLYHAMIVSNQADEILIDWDNEGFTKLATRYLRTKEYLPVNEKLVELAEAFNVGNRYYRWYGCFETQGNNPAFQNVKAYTLSGEMFKATLTKIKLNVFTPKNEFSWDSIESAEDYILKFAEDIERRLLKNINPLYNPEKISEHIFEGSKPYDGQIPVIQGAIEVLKKDKFVYLACQQGFGKAGKNSAKVYTPTGYTTLGKIKVGDEVLNPSGGIAKVIGVFPQGEQDIYRVTFSDHSFADVTKEHLWNVNTSVGMRQSKEWKVMSTEEISKKDIVYFRKGVKFSNFFIPMVEAMDFKPQEIRVDPYLLGLLLGDGSFLHGVSFTKNDAELYKYLGKVAEDYSCSIKMKIDKRNGVMSCKMIKAKNSGGKNVLFDILKDYGLADKYSYEKFIPDCYKYNSKDIRLSILQGLFDTDGYTEKTNIEYNTSSHQLAYDVKEIVESLGGLAIIAERIPSYTYKGEKKLGRINYRVSVKLHSKYIPFRLQRKAIRYSPIGMYQPKRSIQKIELIGRENATCILLDSDNHLYATDSFVVTHNTSISVKVNYALQKEKGKVGYSTLVVCPAITIGQWKEEIMNNTGGNAVVHVIRHTSDFINLWQERDTNIPTYYLVGKETFKLDSKRIPAFLNKKRKVEAVERIQHSYWEEKRNVIKEMSLAVCPNCFQPMQNKNRNDPVFLQAEDFGATPKKSNYKCPVCDTVLWQHTYDKTKKTSLINYIKTKNIKFDMVVIDEAHQANNPNSIIGNATRTLFAYGKKLMLLTGTTNNGYASSLHNLLMGLFSRKMKEKGVLDIDSFIQKYGTLQAKTAIEDGNYYRRGRNQVKESDYREIEGINPVLFAQYLASNYIFATLDMLGKDLPELKEEYVPVMAGEELRKGQEKFAEDLKDVTPYMYKMFEDSLIRHYVNNPYGWNHIPLTNSNGEEEMVYPCNLNPGEMQEKEKKLVEIVKQEILEGRKVWIYADFTGEGDTKKYMKGINIPERLISTLKIAGIKAYWLKPNVKNIDRKEKIEENVENYSVFISNPNLVNVGINMAWCSTYIFLMPSYHSNVIDQASRRGYRANSTQENRIYYLYYTNTIESDICARLQRKQMEAKAIQAIFKVAGDASLRTSSSFGNRINESLTKTMN